MNGIDQKRVEAQKKIREAYGTVAIFKRRARFYRNGQRAITFLGIALPVLVGGVVLSFSNYPQLLPLILPVVGIAGVAQLILSVWSVVNKWDDAYENSIKALDRNAELQFKWEGLAAASAEELAAGYEHVRWETAQQATADEKQNVTAEERRRGMRAALFKFQTPCAICQRVPASPKPSLSDPSCDCCGNF